MANHNKKSVFIVNQLILATKKPWANTVRVILAVLAIIEWTSHQLDIKNAFLHDFLKNLTILNLFKSYYISNSLVAS